MFVAAKPADEGSGCNHCQRFSQGIIADPGQSPAIGGFAEQIAHLVAGIALRQFHLGLGGGDGLDGGRQAVFRPSCLRRH